MFGEIAEVACENHETNELLFSHLQAFVHTHDMSPPTKAYNNETDYPPKTHSEDETPERNHSINDNLNTNIHIPIPVKRKGRLPFKRLKSTCEIAPRRKKTVHANHTSSTNNGVSINLVFGVAKLCSLLLATC